MFRPALILGTAVWLAGCSIQRDQPGFVYPDTQTPAGTPPPELQPTEALIGGTEQDREFYDATVQSIEARKNTLLRRAAQLAEAPI